MDKVGGLGKYQMITLGFWCLCCLFCGGFEFITSYLFFEDPYECPASLDLGGKSCFNYVCALPSEQRHPFVPLPSMSTLANNLGDYRCEEEAAILSLHISFMYANGIVAFILLSVLGEWLGRKKVIVIGMIVMIGGIALALFSTSLLMAVAGLFVGLVGAQWHFNVGLVYISETVAESHRHKFMVIAQFFHGFGVLANTGYYYGLRDWRQVFLFGYVAPAAVLLVALLCVVTDTPICLIQKYSSEEALAQFLKIAKINGVENP
jgi:MFS family permease